MSELDNPPTWEESFSLLDAIICEHHLFASPTLPPDAFHKFLKEAEQIRMEQTPHYRLQRSLNLLSQYMEHLPTNPIRSLRRVRTTAPVAPLKIAYDPCPSMPSNHWHELIEKNENLLIKSYQKLVTYNPNLRDKIEPVLAASKAARLTQIETDDLITLLGKQTALLDETIEHAFCLSEISSALQEIESSQLALIKDSQEAFSTLKTLNSTEIRRLGRKKTYLNIIYADASEDNLPIQTVLKLISDIKDNQRQLQTLEENKTSA